MDYGDRICFVNLVPLKWMELMFSYGLMVDKCYTEIVFFLSKKKIVKHIESSLTSNIHKWIVSNVQ